MSVSGEGSSMYHGRAEAGRTTKFSDAPKERSSVFELTTSDSAATPSKNSGLVNALRCSLFYCGYGAYLFYQRFPSSPSSAGMNLN
jgi:hypothetical protein